MLKRGALSSKIIVNPFTLSGYAMFGVVVVLSRYYLTSHTLKSIALVMAFNFISMHLSSCMIFKERLTFRGVWGVVLIAVGIVIFNLPDL